MTPPEIDRFIKKQLNMGARIAQKASRARIGAAAFSNVKNASGHSLGDRIIAALDRPGVAPSSRPISKDGAQTFHFALTTVSRTSEFAAKTKNDLAGKAADHMSYIEREGAAETLDADVRRDAEAIDREAWTILGGQDYIERPGAAEVLTDGRTIASFGNIAETLEDRVAYWSALEKAAAKPKTHGIIADRTKDAAFWSRVDGDPAAPAILRSTHPWIALPVHQSAPDADELNRPIAAPRVTDKIAIAVAQYAAKHRSRSRIERPAVAIDPGRGGRIQNRIIVELPYELSPEGRLKLAQDFCHKHFVEGRAQPIPHWCVIHAPDHHNDPRNTHMHIVFAERPTKRMIDPSTGSAVWDFEIIETTTDKHWNKRSRRPFEQPTDRTLQDRSWVKKARSSYAELANAALLAAGKSKIYDARTYKAMGIDVDPRKRINGKDYVKEKKGISTNAGTAAVLDQWRREEDRLVARHPSFEPDPKIWARFDKEIQRWQRSSTSTKYKLMIMRHEWNIAQAHRRYHAAEAAANAFIMRKIKSKLAPPLGTDAQTARDATDYLRMFKADLIDKHGKASQHWKRNERYALTILQQAARADPKTSTMDTFLDGTAVMQAARGMMTDARIRAASHPLQTVQQMLNTTIKITQAIVEEHREVSSAQSKVEAARQGRVEDYPIPFWERAAMSAHAGEVLQVPDPETLPKWGADGEGRYEIRPRPAAGDASGKPPRAELREARPSDEKGFMFLSDTGAPVQRRVISASMIRRTEERAAAIIAAAHQRRIEREQTAAALAEIEGRAARAQARIERDQERAASAAAEAPRVRPDPTLTVPPGTGIDPRPATTVQATINADRPIPNVDPTTPAAAGARTEKAMIPQSAQVDAPLSAPVPQGPATGEADRGRVAAAAPLKSAVDAPQRPTANEIGKPLPLLDESATVGPPHRAEPTTPRGEVAESTSPPTKGVSIRLEDIEVTDEPPKRRLTAEQLRQRALLAAQNRGRGR